MDELQQLKELANAYVKEKADAIIKYMAESKLTNCTESTCDLHWYGWDKKYHQMFPRIAEELRKRGLSVSSKINFGVTDWYISV